MVDTDKATKAATNGPPAPTPDSALPPKAVQAAPKTPADTLAVLVKALTGLNDSMQEIKSLLVATPAAKKAAAAKANGTGDEEWARRIEANKAAGRTMSTARFFCGAPDCGYHCYVEDKIKAHVAKKGAPHVQKAV